MDGRILQDGDSVRHEADGRLMTVRAVSGGYAYCEWHDDEGVHAGTFLLESLEKVEPLDKASASSLHGAARH